MKIENLTGLALDWAVSQCTEYQWEPEKRPSRCFDCKHYEERQGRDDAIQYCHHPKMDFNDGSDGDNWGSDFDVHNQCPYKTEVQIVEYPKYSTNWTVGGPIIKGIEFKMDKEGVCASFVGGSSWYGDDYLVAAMRCIVSSKFGKEIEIPNDLLT